MAEECQSKTDWAVVKTDLQQTTAFPDDHSNFQSSYSALALATVPTKDWKALHVFLTKLEQVRVILTKNDVKQCSQLEEDIWSVLAASRDG